MFEKVKQPPRKIWTQKDKRAYHEEMQALRRNREVYRKRLDGKKR
jgi:hypothetical protein